MSTAKDHKKFTANGDAEAEMLLERVLSEIGETLSGTPFCVVLGGSYGRGDGGVRLDRENGILYNDLDFFVFARNKNAGAGTVFKTISEKYEHELKIDVDFSSVMTVQNIKNNAPRLMMQELKRGYHLVYGEDLLAEYLPELPAEKLPFSEACRLLLNRGMGLMLAGEKISGSSGDTDFILRNICKGILGAGDAMLISEGRYCWKIAERLELIEKSGLPDEWKHFYREAVDFKRSPNRQRKQDMTAFWNGVRDFFQFAALRCAGAKDPGRLREGIWTRCCQQGESSLKNYVKYCIKSRTLPIGTWKYYTMPPVALLVADLFSALNEMPEKIDRQSKLFRYWQIFN